MNNETVNIPITPSSSFRESVRKSLRKLGRNKKKRDMKRRKENESIYEGTERADKADREHDDTYEVIETNDTEYIDNGDDRIIIEYESRKPSFRDINSSQSLTSAEKLCGDIPLDDTETIITSTALENDIADVKDLELKENKTSFSASQSEMIPRGPLGDLMKKKQSQSAVNQMIIHKDLGDDEIFDQNIDFKVGQIVMDIEPEYEAEDVETEQIGCSVGRRLTSAVVIHPRQGTTRTELDLRAGEIVFLQRRLDSEWYLGQKKGVGGLIPAAYIQ